MKQLLSKNRAMRASFAVVLLSVVPILHGFNRPAGDSVAAALLEYYKNVPVEKIYVQTDRSHYSAGQVVWYKMYAEGYGLPSKISQVGYVQLVNKEGKIVSTQKLRLENGGAEGNLPLPDSLANDVYQIRAFTAWMLNFSESGIFHKDIFVGNFANPNSMGNTTSTVGKDFHVDFFPEGGDLMAGIKSQVAFKACDAQGVPVAITGVVKDDAGAQEGSLAVTHDGMGEFEFIPSAGHHYSAEVHFPNGSYQKISLPEVKTSGVSLHVVDQTPDLVNLRIVSREKTPGEFRHLQLAAFQSCGKVAVYQIELDPGVNLFDLHKKDFRSGILNVTVLDGENPLAERLIYLHNDDEAPADLVSDTLSFDPRSKSAFTIRLTGPFAQVEKGNLSVSVTDADRVKTDPNQEDILSGLLADPELDGNVFNSAYYFDGQGQDARQALDLVMMTHHWSRFSWKDVFTKNPAAALRPAERSLFLTGRMENFANRSAKTTSGIELTFRNQDFSSFTRDVIPDVNGNFRVDDLLAYGNCSVNCPTGGAPKGSKVEFYHSFVDSMTSAPFYALPMEPVNPAPGAGRSPEDVASDRASLRQIHQAMMTEYMAYPLYGSKFDDYNLSDHSFAASTRLFDWLRGRFPGLEVQGIETNPHFYMDNMQVSSLATASQIEGKANPSDTLNSEPYFYTENVPGNDLPYFYVNEIPVTFDIAKNIPLSDIGYIRYFRPPVKFMPPGTGLLGVIAIYTKFFNEPGSESEPSKDGTVTYFTGYSINRQHFQVRYKDGAKAIGDPDLRTTLYWNGNLKAGDNGDFHFSFYSSDRARRYRIVVEGIDNSGRIIHIDKVIAMK